MLKGCDLPLRTSYIKRKISSYIQILFFNKLKIHLFYLRFNKREIII